MKQLVLLMVCSFFAVPLFSQDKPDDTCTGAVGDVKYSILDASKFREVNGDCWVLMDGRDLPTGNTLKEMGFSKIPDGRGVFLRGVDNRTSGRLDVDRPFGTEVGHYQEDGFKVHQHTSVLYSDGRPAVNGASTGSSAYGWALGGHYTTAGTNVTGGAGGNETRPKNIIVWTYIRID